MLVGVLLHVIYKKDGRVVDWHFRCFQCGPNGVESKIKKLVEEIGEKDGFQIIPVQVTRMDT